MKKQETIEYLINAYRQYDRSAYLAYQHKDGATANFFAGHCTCIKSILWDLYRVPGSKVDALLSTSPATLNQQA